MGTFQYTNELPSISWHHCCVKSGLCGKEFVNAKMSQRTEKSCTVQIREQFIKYSNLSNISYLRFEIAQFLQSEFYWDFEQDWPKNPNYLDVVRTCRARILCTFPMPIGNKLSEVRVYCLITLITQAQYDLTTPCPNINV